MDKNGRDMGEKRKKRGQSKFQRGLLSVLSVVRRLYLADFGDSRERRRSGDLA